MNELKVEILQPDDYKEFIVFYDRVFGLVPKLKDANFIVLKDDERIVGCLGMYRPVVLDSMGLDPEYRGKGCWKMLIEGVTKLYKWPVGSGVHFFAFKPREIALARKFGMRQMSSLLFRKVF